jgi:hypothetical protein
MSGLSIHPLICHIKRHGESNEGRFITGLREEA